MLTYETIILLLIFILPVYLANAAPVMFKELLSKAKSKHAPMDFKAKFYDSRRILGKGKTWAGFFVGILTGTIVGIIIAKSGVVELYPSQDLHILSALLLSTGAMCGDAVGSFIKRRLKFGSGKPFYVVDQLSFFLTSILFVLPIRPEVLNIVGFIFLFVITIILHVLTNIFAYKIGLKKVPW